MTPESEYDRLIRDEHKCTSIFDLLDHKSSLPDRTGHILDAEMLIYGISTWRTSGGVILWKRQHHSK